MEEEEEEGRLMMLPKIWFSKFLSPSVVHLQKQNRTDRRGGGENILNKRFLEHISSTLLR